jgi:hypothetical protein
MSEGYNFRCSRLVDGKPVVTESDRLIWSSKDRYVTRFIPTVGDIAFVSKVAVALGMLRRKMAS